MMDGLPHRWKHVVGLLVLLGAGALDASPEVDFTAAERREILRLSPPEPARFRDPTNRWSDDERAVSFGRVLFFDTRLSRDGSGSCATCHVPSRGWAGGNMSVTRGGTHRKPPNLTNVAYSRWFNWDGSADSLWAQCVGPIESPRELATSRVEIARRTQNESDLRARYELLFGPIPAAIAPDRLPPEGRPVPEEPSHPQHQLWVSMSEVQRSAVNELLVNIAKAIAAFEATLVSDRSPFDRFVEGLRNDDLSQMATLSVEAQRGLRIFLGKGRCALCHSGPNFSDSEFHSVLPGRKGGTDLGRWDGIARLRASELNFDSVYNDAAPGAAFPWVRYVARTVENRHQFKTPTLRNAASIGTYMHDGRFTTLEQVIEHYNAIDSLKAAGDHTETVLVALGLTPEEKRDLVAFIHSLEDSEMLGRMHLASSDL